ncbi:MAG: hypothetical protein ABI551_21220, partial [Polyangiaceae bacterium]
TASATTVSFATADSTSNDLQAVASAGGGRYWILAGGALVLWDARTDDIALARKASPLRDIVSTASGEAWAVGSGLLHFTPPPAPPSSAR